MKYLAYAILGGGEAARVRLPSGPEGLPVALLSETDLAAAFSCFPDPLGPPTRQQLLDYAQVIEALHRQGTVLPLRYGCLLDSEEQLRALMNKRRASLLACLEEVSGCEEMTLRVLLPRADAPVVAVPPQARLSARAEAPVPAVLPQAGEKAALPSSSGTSYLLGRQARYAERDNQGRESDILARTLQQEFGRLFRRCLQECWAAPQAQVLSLHFLVPRENTEAFCQTFRRIQDRSDQRLLLSGPWPPYHFVSLEKAKQPP